MALQYDVCVVGGGHAGIEAALAASRLGCKTVLITNSIHTIGRLSCNPAIGGLAKGQLVREIDALGGAMAKVADYAGLQFRMLSTSKGPAIRSPRAQCDRDRYSIAMREILEKTPNLQIIQDDIDSLIVENQRLVGALTRVKLEIQCKATVLCCGTFLDSCLHVGVVKLPGGRWSEAPSLPLAESMQALGLPLLRLRTGTSPRIRGNSCDYSHPGLVVQPGDVNPQPFSFANKRVTNADCQKPCYLTHTNAESIEIVQSGLEFSPIAKKRVKGEPPRYCPSIEVKVMRFPERKNHPIHLEPDGFVTDEIYLNNLSTSLPPEMQVRLVRTLPGLAKAEIVRWGYAVEYIAISPRSLKQNLESKDIAGLFTAGQINGTSGYEEAAAQGLIAGANAALSIQQREPLIIGRREAYTGVLINDIVTRGVDEPYRLFTSRAEHRLHLRQDNADVRLYQKAYQAGLISRERYLEVADYAKAIADTEEKLENTRFQGLTLANHLRRADCTWSTMLNWLSGENIESASEDKRNNPDLSGDLFVNNSSPDNSHSEPDGESGDYQVTADPTADNPLPERFSWLKTIPPRVAEQAWLNTRYSGYLRREDSQAEKLVNQYNMPIPPDFNYSNVIGFRNETREKLTKIRPDTIGAAANIPGISPADLTLLALRILNRKA